MCSQGTSSEAKKETLKHTRGLFYWAAPTSDEITWEKYLIFIKKFPASCWDNQFIYVVNPFSPALCLSLKSLEMFTSIWSFISLFFFIRAMEKENFWDWDRFIDVSISLLPFIAPTWCMVMSMKKKKRHQICGTALTLTFLGRFYYK